MTIIFVHFCLVYYIYRRYPLNIIVLLKNQIFASYRSKHQKTVWCCSTIKTPPNSMMLHKRQNTTKQNKVAQKSKHHQTVWCCTKIKTPPNSMMLHKNQNTTKHDFYKHKAIYSLNINKNEKTGLLKSLYGVSKFYTVHTILVSVPRYTQC